MDKVKLAIIYYSSTGTNYKLAKWAKNAGEEMGAEVRLLKVEELAPDAAIDSNPAWREHVNNTKDVAIATSDDLVWADAIIFSTATRFGNISSQLKQFIDIQGGPWSQGKLNNKVVSAMCSAGNTHGGQGVTLQALYTSMMHWGAIIVPPGYTDSSIYKAGGSPYGVAATIDQEGNIQEDVEDAVVFQAQRTIKAASAIKKVF